MANSKISALTSATTPLAGTETLPIVQSGATKQVAVADLTAGRAVSASSMTLTTALAATSGGTGSTSAFTSNGVAYASSTTALSTSTAFQFNGTNIGLGGASTGSPASSRIIEAPSENLILATGAGAVTSIYANVKFTGASGTTQYASNYYALLYQQNIGNGEHRWYTAPAGTTGAAPTFTQRLTLESANGNLTLNTGNLVQGTAAKGVDFSANSTSAGKTSTLLNWYEEGTYTATVTCGTSGTITLKSTSDALQYTRIGRKITVSGMLDVNSVSSPVGYFAISLPYNINDLTENSGRSATAVLCDGTVSAVPNAFYGIGIEGTAQLRVYIANSGTAIAATAANQIQANTAIWVNFTYVA